MTFVQRLIVTTATTAALAVAGITATATVPTTMTVTAAAASTAADDGHPNRLPRIATEWAQAWNSGNPQLLAGLFTADARYTDHAFGATFTGRDGVAQWATITGQSIQDATITVDTAFRRGDQVAIVWTFSGQLVGAPQPFSVPAATVLRLRGGHIASDDDYYNLADVLRQSGLPADTTFG